MKRFLCAMSFVFCACAAVGYSAQPSDAKLPSGGALSPAAEKEDLLKQKHKHEGSIRMLQSSLAGMKNEQTQMQAYLERLNTMSVDQQKADSKKSAANTYHMRPVIESAGLSSNPQTEIRNAINEAQARLQRIDVKVADMNRSISTETDAIAKIDGRLAELAAANHPQVPAGAAPSR